MNDHHMFDQTMFDDQGRAIDKPLETDLRKKQIRALSDNGFLPPGVLRDRRMPKPMPLSTKLKLAAGAIGACAAGALTEAFFHFIR